MRICFLLPTIILFVFYLPLFHLPHSFSVDFYFISLFFSLIFIFIVDIQPHRIETLELFNTVKTQARFYAGCNYCETDKLHRDILQLSIFFVIAMHSMDKCAYNYKYCQSRICHADSNIMSKCS